LTHMQLLRSQILVWNRKASAGWVYLPIYYPNLGLDQLYRSSLLRLPWNWANFLYPKFRTNPHHITVPSYFFIP
jgi:hypothetical protein